MSHLLCGPTPTISHTHTVNLIKNNNTELFSMPNMNSFTRTRLFPMIVIKQKGEYCAYCNRDPFILESLNLDPKLRIDHINNDNSDNRLENLQLLCVPCNTKKNHHRNIIEPTKRDMPGEYDIGKANEAKFTNYAFGRIIIENSLERKALIADGAYFCGCSVQAIKNYLFKMTSPTHGIYLWEKRNDGKWYLLVKPEYK